MQGLVEDFYLDRTLEDSSISKNEKYLAKEIKSTSLEKAIRFYKELIDSFPKSKLVYRALNNKGFAELELKNKSAAKITFQKIIDSEAMDIESGGVGNGIMGEPYANYKNRAAKTLAKLYIEDSNYKAAIKSLDKTNEYPYRHFCGNEQEADELLMTELYATSYLGLKDTVQALKLLLPNILDNALADNSNIVRLTFKILLGKYSKQELRELFEDSFKLYTTKKIKRNDNSELEECYITFLGTDIQVNSFYFDFAKSTKKQQTIEKICKSSLFYRSLK